jgi:hypothetical protein
LKLKASIEYLSKNLYLAKIRQKYQILMFNIPAGVCFNFYKISVTASSVCISLFGDFELQVSACNGHHQVALKNMNMETLLLEREGLPPHSGIKIY